jgi:hypothetical protein
MRFTYSRTGAKPKAVGDVERFAPRVRIRVLVRSDIQKPQITKSGSAEVRHRCDPHVRPRSDCWRTRVARAPAQWRLHRPPSRRGDGLAPWSRRRRSMQASPNCRAQDSRATFVPVGFPLGPVEPTELALFGALANPPKRRASFLPAADRSHSAVPSGWQRDSRLAHLPRRTPVARDLLRRYVPPMRPLRSHNRDDPTAARADRADRPAAAPLLP